MKLRIRKARKNPAPFHDGMHEEKARLHVTCGECSHDFDENLLSCLAEGEKWFRSLMERDQQQVAEQFGYTYEVVGPKAIPCISLKNNRRAYLINLSCPVCNTLTLAAVDFYEMQPARYIAKLVGLAQVEKNVFT